LGLLPVMALWSVLFYYGMVNEINDEADDALGEYAQLVMRRVLAGQPLPAPNNGSNNSYSITPVDEDYMLRYSPIQYYDEMVYIPEKEETEPARVLRTFFCDAEGQHYEIQVATPTFERADLLKTIAWNMALLYLVLMLTIFTVVALVYYFNMRPLYRLLQWLDGYTPGAKKVEVPTNTSVVEFRKLSEAAQRAMNRTEQLFEQQKQFIGNASHELQTPLAILGNRLEWLVNNTSPNEQQLTEMLKMRQSLARLVRLNKTLLLLSKIENEQFPESSDVDIAAIVRDNLEIYSEIYEERGITEQVELPESYIVHMNESLTSTLINNLLKNSYLHNMKGGTVKISINGDTLTIANSGTEALDPSLIFERFYHKGGSDSTGLGLALVSSIARNYNLAVTYTFTDNMHTFSIRFNSK
jgi:signal transduction histidine kinase